MNKGSRFISILLCLGLLLSRIACFAETDAASGSDGCFPGRFWTKDSPTIASLTAFVASVTDPASDSFLPEENRIAVFDFDGTLYGELFPTYFDVCLFLHRALHDPTCTPPEDVAAYAAALEESLALGLPEPKSPRSTAQMAAECFRGMTLDEYRACIRAFMAEPVKGFSGMSYGEAFFSQWSN